MNADDFIDCIAWCGRNISEFTPDYKNTQDFLETCDGLFKYLKGKNAISNDTVPGTAAEILLQEGKMNIILPDGSLMKQMQKERGMRLRIYLLKYF